MASPVQAIRRIGRGVKFCLAIARKNRELDRLEVDPRVSYPSYKSLDALIDVDRLKSLDGYLTDRIMTHLSDSREAERFHTGAFKRRFWHKSVPGAVIIPLTKSIRPFQYQDLNEPDLWEATPHADAFSELMDFVGTMPFEATARILIVVVQG